MKGTNPPSSLDGDAMPTFDCNAQATISFEVNDRIEADSVDEANSIFEKRFEAGEYDDQLRLGRKERDFLNYGAKED